MKKLFLALPLLLAIVQSEAMFSKAVLNCRIQALKAKSAAELAYKTRQLKAQLVQNQIKEIIAAGEKEIRTAKTAGEKQMKKVKTAWEKDSFSEKFNGIRKKCYNKFDNIMTKCYNTKCYEKFDNIMTKIENTFDQNQHIVAPMYQFVFGCIMLKMGILIGKMEALEQAELQKTEQ